MGNKQSNNIKNVVLTKDDWGIRNKNIDEVDPNWIQTLKEMKAESLNKYGPDRTVTALKLTASGNIVFEDIELVTTTNGPKPKLSCFKCERCEMQYGVEDCYKGNLLSDSPTYGVYMRSGAHSTICDLPENLHLKTTSHEKDFDFRCHMYFIRMMWSPTLKEHVFVDATSEDGIRLRKDLLKCIDYQSKHFKDAKPTKERLW